MSGAANAAWPREVREEALKLAREYSPAAAARILDERGVQISQHTIQSWIRREGLKVNAAIAAAEHVDVELLSNRGMEWSERRPMLIAELGLTAASALEATKLAIAGGRSVDARNYATTVGILTDKLNLLSGGPTSRSQNVTMHVEPGKTEALQREIKELEAEIASERKELGA